MFNREGVRESRMLAADKNQNKKNLQFEQN